MSNIDEYLIYAFLCAQMRGEEIARKNIYEYKNRSETLQSRSRSGSYNLASRSYPLLQLLQLKRAGIQLVILSLLLD